MKNYLLKASEYRINTGFGSEITLEDGIRMLILILIALTPIFSIGEIIDLFLSRVKSRSENSTPIYIKAIKDLGFMIIIITSTLMVIRRGKYRKHLFYALLILFITVVACIFSTILIGELKKAILVVIMGIRWLVPFLVTFFLVDIVNKTLLHRITKVLSVVFFIHLALQGAQLIFMGGYYGLNFLGLAARVPGFFLIPSTAAFFTILVCFFQLYFGNYSKRVQRIFILLTTFSVVITQSGAGFVVYFLVMALYLTPQKFLKLSILCAPLMGIGLLLLFVITSDRGGAAYVEASGGVRVEIMKKVITDTGLISTTFGVGTNAARILNSGELMDSQIASLVYNLGILFALFVIILFGCWLVLLYQRNNKMLYSFTAIYFLVGAASIFFEAFPMNLLFSVLLAFLIKQKDMRLFY